MLRQDHVFIERVGGNRDGRHGRKTWEAVSSLSMSERAMASHNQDISVKLSKGWLQIWLREIAEGEWELARTDKRTSRAHALKKGLPVLEAIVAYGLITELGYTIDDLIENEFSLEVINLAMVLADI